MHVICNMVILQSQSCGQLTVNQQKEFTVALANGLIALRNTEAVINWSTGMNFNRHPKSEFYRL